MTPQQAMPGQDAVVLEKITYRYGSNTAIENMAFSVLRGEIFGLVGPDGAGKTTTLRMICGLLVPSEGRCLVLGFNPATQKRETNKRIGYLSQRFSLYTDLTVDENIEFFAQIHSVRNYRSAKAGLLEFTRLDPFRRRLAAELSGGMKQKLALACTLIHEPEVLLLDEPTAGVDPVSRRDFWKILNALLVRGLTILMSTSYLDEAERCSRIALVNRGRVVVCDRPENVRRSLRSRFIEVLCSPLREVASHSRFLEGVSSVQLFGDRIHVGFDAGRTDAKQIHDALVSRGISIQSVRGIVPSLEDAFITLIS